MSDVLLRPVGSLATIAGTGQGFALTFDDGPDPVWTPPLLELLSELEVTATFFLLTQQTSRFPRLVRRIHDAGHEIALHGDDHTKLTTLPIREVRKRIRTAKSQLEQTAGIGVRWFRPPFGAQSAGTYAATRQAGLDVAIWGPHARDWEDGTPQEVANRAAGTVHPGDILLLHDGLEMPPGSPRPTFDRTAMFRLLLNELHVQGLMPDSIGHLVSIGRPIRSAWFRP